MGCPEKLQILCHWKCSRAVWMGLWAIWSSGRFPVHGRRIRWPLRSLSTQPFYDSIIYWNKPGKILINTKKKKKKNQNKNHQNHQLTTVLCENRKAPLKGKPTHITYKLAVKYQNACALQAWTHNLPFLRWVFIALYSTCSSLNKLKWLRLVLSYSSGWGKETTSIQTLWGYKNANHPIQHFE